MKTGDTGFTVFRLLTKSRTWVWVQSIARVVFKAGKPDFIVARQRALTYVVKDVVIISTRDSLTSAS